MKDDMVMFNGLECVKKYRKTTAYNDSNTYGTLEALVRKMPDALADRKKQHMRKMHYAHVLSKAEYTVEELI